MFLVAQMSLTDAVSFACMTEKKLRTAFSFDHQSFFSH